MEDQQQSDEQSKIEQENEGEDGALKVAAIHASDVDNETGTRLNWSEEMKTQFPDTTVLNLNPENQKVGDDDDEDIAAEQRDQVDEQIGNGSLPQLAEINVEGGTQESGSLKNEDKRYTKSQ